MTKYYIKDGYGESGPFTIDELRQKKINPTTFVRSEENETWFLAVNLPSSKQLVSSRKRKKKVYGLIILSILIAYTIFFSVNNLNFSTNTYEKEINSEEVIPPPPTIQIELTEHKKKFLKELFKDCNLSGDKKKLVNACNYSNSIVRNMAVSIAGESAGNYNLGQICNIFDYCYNNWKYVNDPKTLEFIEFASNTIINGLNGDCDDFAVLICSMILSIGGEARINFAYGTEGGHAFTEVNIGNTNKSEIENYLKIRYKSIYSNIGIATRTDNDNSVWLNLDWFAKHPGGKYFDYTSGTTFYILQQFCYDF